MPRNSRQNDREVMGASGPIASLNRPKKAVKRVKSQDRGTLEGMLFQINENLKRKRSYIDRLRGELAYLERRREELELEILHRGKASKKAPTVEVTRVGKTKSRGR